MAAQDEGRVRFDDLPLAALKRWIEEWSDLTKSTLPGDIFGPAATETITQTGEIEFFYDVIGDVGIQIPKWRGWSVADKTFTGDIECVRFSVWEDVTISGYTWFSPTATNVADTYDGGIYSADGLTLLADSNGASSQAAVLGNDRIKQPFTSNLDLVAGTKYILALLQYGGGGSANDFVAVDTSGSTVAKWHGDSIGQALQFTVSIGGGWTALPNTAAGGLPFGGFSGYNASAHAGPFAILNPV